MNQSQADPVIDEIREVHHRISARVDHEPARLVARGYLAAGAVDEPVLVPRSSIR